MTGVDWVPPVDLGNDTGVLRDLLKVWRSRTRMNVQRSRFYDGERGLRDFGISLPPNMQNIGAALGWTGKGVRAFTNRSQFEEFVLPSGVDDPFAITELLESNNFFTEFPAACVSSAMHGCSFFTVTQGDTSVGEPAVLIMARSAEDSAALWDKRRREISAFLSVVDTVDGEPTELILYTREFVYEVSKVAGRWGFEKRPHGLGEVPAYPLVHGYELRRPLGHARISRASMYFVDAALRTIVRSEVSSEFYSAVEYWLFGADVTQFLSENPWDMRMGTVKALDVDSADGESNPVLHRFNGASPQPHIDQMRMWANLFADEMDLEVKFADSANPSSADAIFAAKETQIVSVRDANRLWGSGAARAVRAAVRLRDRLESNSPELLSLRSVFTDPAIVSPGSRAAAFDSFARNIPGFASTRTGLRFGGFSSDQVDQLSSELRSSGVASLVERLRGGVNDSIGNVGDASAEPDTAEVVS